MQIRRQCSAALHSSRGHSTGLLHWSPGRKQVCWVAHHALQSESRLIVVVAGSSVATGTSGILLPHALITLSCCNRQNMQQWQAC
jgi:hypothetical protein